MDRLSSGIRVKRLDYIPTLVAMSMIPVYGQKAVNYRQVVAAAVVSDTLDYNEKIYINRLKCGECQNDREVDLWC
jgi:hypothetical protein